METDICTHIKLLFTKLKSVEMTKQQFFITENNLQKVGWLFFLLVPLDNRTNVNVEAWIPSLTLHTNC
jgi:hypothetical protein